MIWFCKHPVELERKKVVSSCPICHNEVFLKCDNIHHLGIFHPVGGDYNVIILFMRYFWMGLEWVTIITIRMKIMKKSIFSPWMGICRVCWGWRRCQSHRSSLLLARVLLRTKNNIRKIEMFENFKKKNNMSSSSSPFIKIETIEFLKKKDQYLFALVFVREKNIRELQIWQILNKLDSF